MIVENTEVFQSWLTKILKPLCDADPAALAKYVLALIKKDKTEKELRQSMSDQLDVFLQQETKPFVSKLFEALKTKEYLIAKPADPPSTSKSDPSGDKVSDEATGNKGDKPPPASAMSSQDSDVASTTSSSSVTTVTSSQSSSTMPASTQSSQSSSTPLSSPSVDGKKVPNTLSVTQSALLSTEPSNSSSSQTESVGGPKDDSKSRRDRRDQDDRDRRRKRSTRLERDRRNSRSRSGDRNKRSRSPRLRDRNDRMRHRLRKSPPLRRFDRDGWDRRRSRSPIRNRSSSPRNRSRTPPRYRRPFNSSRSRSRSPVIRDRTRSRSRSRSPSGQKDKKDSLLPLPMGHADSDLSSISSATSPEKPMVQSVVVRPGVAQIQGDPATVQGAGSIGNRCRDFDEKGLCMRGELCPFDHGQDPVVLEDVVVSGSGGPGYVGRGVPGGPGYNAPLGRPGEYYPDNPSLEQPVGWGPGVPPGYRPRHLGFDQVQRGRGGILLRPSAMGPYPVSGPGRQLISVPVVGVPPTVPVMGDMRGPHPPMPPMQMHPMRGLHGMRGRGRGGFDHGRLGAKPPRNYTNCSLEVRKIPREQNTIMDLNSHFHRFGKIVNIQISFENDPEAALVTFSSPAEAQLAYRSTEAVLNNRFIRVFWHNKEKENEDEGDPQSASSNPTGRIPVKDRLGAQADPMDNESKILISGNSITKTVYNPAALLNRKTETSQEKLQTVESIKRNQEMLAAHVNLKNLQEQKKQEAMKMTNDLRKRQQTMMEEVINQQKKLIAKIESGKLKPEEKEETLKLIKGLQDSATKLKKDLDESNPKPVQKKQTLPVSQTREEAQKEMLDAEMDLYNQELQGGDTNFLQMKVMELRARARSMGLIGGRGHGHIRGSYRGGRGFRGRGMMRGGRGRGIVRALRTVDRRPTKIRVTGFPNDRLQDLLSQFTLFGPIRDCVTNNAIPEVIIDFDSRKNAEVAMANGQIFEDLMLNLEWVTDNSGDKIPDASTDDPSTTDDLDTSGSLLDDDDDDEDELGDILNSEILLTGEEEDEDEEDRSWRR